MASGFEVVAGTIGIAGVAQQFTKSILEIKTFCKDVKAAPAELQDLVESIENTGRMLMALGEVDASSEYSSMDEHFFRTSFSLCTNVVDRLATHATELQRRIAAQKRIGAFKFVLEKKDIKELMVKLDRTKNDLQFAYLMLSNVRLRKDHNKLLQNLEVISSIGVKPVQHNHVWDDSHVNGTASPKSESVNLNQTMVKGLRTSRLYTQSHSSLNMRFPLWFSRYAWDFALQRASGCWTMSLKPLQIRPQHHKAMRMCEVGSIDGVRGLLDNRELTLHDEFESGDTLLTVAVAYGHTSLAKFLIQNGTKPVMTAECTYFLTGYAYNWLRWSIDSACTHVRFILEECEPQNFGYEGIESLEAIAQYSPLRTIRQQLTFLEEVLDSQYHEESLQILQSMTTDDALFVGQDHLLQLLFHVLARVWWRHKDRKQMKTELSDQIRRCIQRGADVSAVYKDRETSFLLMLRPTPKSQLAWTRMY